MHLPVFLEREFAELIVHRKRQIGRMLLNAWPPLGLPSPLPGSGGLRDSAAAPPCFSVLCYRRRNSAGGLLRCRRPHRVTCASWSSWELLQFSADPLPEIAYFLCGFAFRLEFRYPKARALRILVRVAQDDEMRADHAEHREPLLRFAIAIAARRRLRQYEGSVFLQAIDRGDGRRRRFHVARRGPARNNAEIAGAYRRGCGGLIAAGRIDEDEIEAIFLRFTR